LDYVGMPLTLYNDCGGANGLSPCGAFPFDEKKVYDMAIFFKSKLIRKIEFSKGIVEFEYEDREDLYNDKKISKIFIKSKSNQLIQAIKLNYDYFSTNYQTLLTGLGDWQHNFLQFADRENYLNNRLKLISLELLDRYNNVINSQ